MIIKQRQSLLPFLFAYFLLGSLGVMANTILPVNQGITLAEISYSHDNQKITETILVLSDQAGRVKAIALGKVTGIYADILQSYQQLGYAKLESIATRHQQFQQQYDYRQLRSPAGQTRDVIALGFNYPEHADEIDQEHLPFIFLKTNPPTRDQAIPYSPSVLLDYEIEICARLMQQAGQTQQREWGFFVCGDFTDRAALLREMDIDNMRSGKGFSIAKSKPGYFPTGPYLVIPKNTDEFLQKINFQLSLNQEKRQSANATQMIWSLENIIDDIKIAESQSRTSYTDAKTNWLVNHEIEPGLVILTGTPEGVIMRPPSTLFKMISGISFVFTGAFTKHDIKQHTIQRYIRHLHKKKIFLQPGDKLELQADYLGYIQLRISEGD